MSSENKHLNLSDERRNEIQAKRLQTKAKGALTKEQGAVYSLICPACTKPNTLSTTFCTGCSFPLQEEDLQKQPANIFKDMIEGKDIGAVIRHRDDSKGFIVFDDKFGVSKNHIDVIPTKVYDDISVLTDEHIPVLLMLYDEGKKELLRRNIPFLNVSNFNEYVSAGYNHPVSIKHLHLHMMVPPYKHSQILQYPRWHSHEKVMNDLTIHGRILTYDLYPDENGKEEQKRAITLSEKVTEIESRQK